MRIVAFVTEAPKLAPSRAPPQGEFAWEEDLGGADELDQRTEHSDQPW